MSRYKALKSKKSDNIVMISTENVCQEEKMKQIMKEMVFWVFPYL